jgi:hypothetical protein
MTEVVKRITKTMSLDLFSGTGTGTMIFQTNRIRVWLVVFIFKIPDSLYGYRYQVPFPFKILFDPGLGDVNLLHYRYRYFFLLWMRTSYGSPSCTTIS